MIFSILNTAFMLYRLLIIGYILMSWVPAMRDSAIGTFLETLVEPYLAFFRKFIPPIGMIDISPIVALFVLSFIESGLYKVLYYLLY